MASVHAIPSLEQEYEFTGESKRRLLIGIGAGVALVALGSFLLASGVGEHSTEVAHGATHSAASEAGHGYKWTTRLWANVWTNAVYFTGISVIGMFFMSYNYLAHPTGR